MSCLFQTTYEDSGHAVIVCQCLQVIGAYISWIDISFIVNDRFVPLLLRFMGAPLLREAASDCLYEIILKGMEPPAKIKLIETFWGLLEERRVFSFGKVGEYILSN